MAFSDAGSRRIAAFLKRVDPDERWADLARHDTAEGLTLYLCPEHLAGYTAPVRDS
jgi:internalin A